MSTKALLMAGRFSRRNLQIEVLFGVGVGGEVAHGDVAVCCPLGSSRTATEWSRLVLHCGFLLGLDFGAELPEETAEFTGNRHFDFVVMNLAFR